MTVEKRRRLMLELKLIQSEEPRAVLSIDMDAPSLEMAQARIDEIEALLIADPVVTPTLDV